MQSSVNDKPLSNLQISWPIVFAGLLLGAVLSWSVLAGDQQGRVNLLYLLFIYLLLPLASIIVSTVSLLKGRGFNLARLVAAFPIWSQQNKMLLNKAHQLKVDKYWFFFQSQMAALAFSVASLAVFFILLVATDVNFIWRSTLLDATDLLPLLQKVAIPWQFWPEAQPSLELLQTTQDSRLQGQGSTSSHVSWWPFVLAVQVVYCLLPRTFLLLATRVLYQAKISQDLASKSTANIQYGIDANGQVDQYAPLVHTLPKHIAVNNWSQITLSLLANDCAVDLAHANLLNAGPLASLSEQRLAERWQGEQLLLVKSWEPPLGELADFMQNGKGYVWPLDWQDSRLQPLKLHHLQEWRRFVSRMEGWKVYVPERLLAEENA